MLLRCLNLPLIIFFFFFNDTATTEIYTLSLHDALPILHSILRIDEVKKHGPAKITVLEGGANVARSEEHTSELQSQSNLVCRLLLEKKKKRKHRRHHTTNLTPRQTTA